jgi:superkiller protein 3
VYFIVLRLWLSSFDEEEYDVAMLQNFVTLFPYSVFATLILAYFAYIGTPPTPDSETPPPITIEYEDSFDVIQVSAQESRCPVLLNTMAQDSYNDLPDSVLASRILVKAFHEDNDYENSIKAAEVGLERTRKLESERGKLFVK